MNAAAFALLQAALIVYLTGAVSALVLRKRDRLATLAGFGLAAAACVLTLSAAVAALSTTGGTAGPSAELVQSWLPYLTLSVRLDALSAFFCLIVSLVGVSLSLYSVGYVRTFYGRKAVGLFSALFNVLLLSTTLVFLADNAFFFLLAWEVMALAAYALVSFEHEEREVRAAGVLFFIMSHIGTGCLILGFLLMFQASGGYTFAGFHALGDKLPSSDRNLLFLLFLVGFGIKAGIVPLHIWLPAAHPVAPSNVSALMSGVLIKTGIYGLTRVLFDFLGNPSVWWGVTILTVGALSAVLGVLYALMEHDLKRLLAYHSIENIGIILVGLGASVLFLQVHRPTLAALALLAALYHTLNHALFKALLFLGAGAVLQTARSRNMEELGGLIKRMPRTAGCFLIGAVAISALPPLNGFVSEWLTYQALLLGFGSTPSLLRLLFPLSGAMLALTGALAAACFVKAFGITFLGQPRSAPAAHAQEVVPSMQLAQAILAASCLVLGLMPSLMLQAIDPVADQLTGARVSQQLIRTGGWAIGTLADHGGTVSTAGIALAALPLLILPFLLRAVFGRNTRVRVGPTWDCGLRGLTPQMQYTATGFSKPIRMIFKALFRPHREVQRDYDYSPYFAKSIRFESHVEEVFERRVYRPLQRALLRMSRRMRALQAGSVQAYLLYIFLTLIALLLVGL